MVKSEKPLQIRLTEPVLFLRGPSTALDFRGRQVAIAADTQPAQLRGLLTLRLNKPTRIRKIEIQLEGKTRTEWPEGIGPRHMETHEEKVLLLEKTTFFSARDSSNSRSRSNRRAASVGPGMIDRSHWDLTEDPSDEDQREGRPREREPRDGTDTRERDDRNAMGMLRSASALPGTHDRNSWHRDGFSRRPSFDDLGDADEEQGEEADPASLKMDRLRISDIREPSPAYTPYPDNNQAGPSRYSLGVGMPSGRRGSSSPLPPPSRQPDLSPIVSAPASRSQSTRDGSSSAERSRIPEHALIGESTTELEAPPELSEEPELDLVESPLAETSAPFVNESGRAASVRTTESFADSTASLSSSSRDALPTTDDLHPISGRVRSTSSASTLPDSHPGSGPASVRARASNDTLNRPVPPGILSQNHSVSSPLATSRSETPVADDVDLTDSRRGSITSPHRPMLNESRRILSDQSGRSVSFSVDGQEQAGPTSLERQQSPTDDRGRRHSKFSLTAALGAMKGRVSSKSRSKTPLRETSMGNGATLPKNRIPSADISSGSGVPAADGRGRSNDSRRPSSNQADFQPPFGRGGAARGSSRSRERTDSPRRDADKSLTGKKDEATRSPSRGRGRRKRMKVLTDALGLGDHAPEEDDVHNWKEFRKGTYNYPISFTIPISTPPTLHAEFGSIAFHLKASVVRVGALTPNLVEDVEVVMISSPQEDDLEETENIVVERQWEEQLRYQVALSGKAFPIGSVIPLSIRLMPLMKCKIYRLSVVLEEKTDYFAHARRVTRHETPKKFILMFLKQPDKPEKNVMPKPLLPIMSESPDAAKESALAPLAAQAAANNPPPDEIDPEDTDWMYAQLLDPMGPWHLERNLQIPDCASTLKCTSKHDKTNMSVGHWLKVTIRVERGDDVAVDNKGRRKQFDIIIDTPIKILDCRVNPQWNSLPTYSVYNPSASAVPTGICSIHGHNSKNSAQAAPLVASKTNASMGPVANADLIISASSFTPPARVVGLPPMDERDRSNSHSRSRTREASRPRMPPSTAAPGEDSLLERNIVYDRLMSGQETETGEIPPTYKEAVANAAKSRNGRSGSRGRSRLRETSDP